MVADIHWEEGWGSGDISPEDKGELLDFSRTPSVL